MSVNTFFDHIYCLNLDRRLDRWTRCEQIFSEYGIENVERFSASDGILLPEAAGTFRGNVGLFDSHRRILQDAIDKDYKNILIFEDDVEFSPKFHNIFACVEQEVDPNWNTLYLGSNLDLWTPHKVSDHLYLAHKVLCGHALGIASHMFKSILDSIVFARPDYCTFADWSMDVLYSYWGMTPFSYVVIPRIAYQRANYSDINGQHVDYAFLKDD